RKAAAYPGTPGDRPLGAGDIRAHGMSAAGFSREAGPNATHAPVSQGEFMNGDTPGAVPSDDTPFLGPAISPRRREGGAPTHEAGELAGPFIGRKFGSTVDDNASAPPAAPGPAVPAEDESYDDVFGG